jgi:molecular chaperone DnaK (HSP70)
MAIQRLREAAEKAKIELSSSIQVSAVLLHCKILISRSNNTVHQDNQV